MKHKIAMVFPYAPVYREAIYREMDKSFDIDWYFAGNAERNLKLLDYTKLKNCNLTLQEKHIIGPITRLKGLNKIDFSDYDAIIIAGVIRCVSEWHLIQKYAGKSTGPKVFLWTHGWYGKETSLQKRIKKFFFRNLDGFLLYGDYAKSLMIKEGFDKNKLFVIKNSLDYKKQLSLRASISPSDLYLSHFGNTNQNIIFIGRLTPVKKLEQILYALDALAKNGERYNLTFVGDGSERQNLENKASELGLADRVWFFGECFDEKLNAEFIFDADLCVAPGNVGLTAIHSLMFGCPVITHNDFKWQMPEFEAIKSGLTGDFFKMDDIDDLSRCISDWFKTKSEHREKVRRECYAEIDTYWNPGYQISVLSKVLNDDSLGTYKG